MTTVDHSFSIFSRAWVKRYGRKEEAASVLAKKKKNHTLTVYIAKMSRVPSALKQQKHPYLNYILQMIKKKTQH